jgi:hypothetical protein
MQTMSRTSRHYWATLSLGAADVIGAVGGLAYVAAVACFRIRG